MNKPTRSLKSLTWAAAHLCAPLLACLALALALASSAAAHSLIDNTISPDPPVPVRHQPQHQQQQQSPLQSGSYQSGRLGLGRGLASQNKCQSGWMWFNNKCWVTTQSRRDFQHAIELCKKMYNSTLPTIHSEDENEFLRQNIDLRNSPIWLYARHNHQYNMTRWQDNTPANFTHWDQGQPNDKSSLICIKTEDNWYMKKAEPVDGQTQCVSFWEDGKWGTQVGCMVLLPVVCERKLAPVSRLPYESASTGAGMSSQYEQQQMPATSAAADHLRLAAGHPAGNLLVLASLLAPLVWLSSALCAGHLRQYY